MLEVSHRYKLSISDCRVFAVEIVWTIRLEMEAVSEPQSTPPERRHPAPMLEIVQARCQASATIRLDESSTKQIDQYAVVLRISADEVVGNSGKCFILNM